MCHAADEDVVGRERSAAATIERAMGRSGELVLRRSGPHLQIVCNGTFLVSTENEASSRALIGAARPLLPARPLDVLVGGLGVGHALDEALELPGLRSVVVAELEPAVIGWFEEHGRELARRALDDARVSLLPEDVRSALERADRSFDLVAMDTDNGPGWLVRRQNARLYGDLGLRAVASALRPGGVAAFWASESDDAFCARLRRRFVDVTVVAAVDAIGRHRIVSYVYAGRRPVPGVSRVESRYG